MFKKCICGSFYGIKRDDCKNSSIFQNAEPSGEKCVDSDDVEWYSDCHCDRSNTSTGYPYSEDDCYPYRPNTAQSCRTRGSTYYKSCLNCDEYPAQNLDHVYNNTACNITLTDKIPNLNSNGTKAGDQSGGKESQKEECSYYYCPNKKNASKNTGPYQIMRCAAGYRVSTDNDYKLDENFEKICEQEDSNGNCVKYAKYKQYEACVPVDCSEAVKYVLKSKNLTGYALFDGASLRDGDGNVITNNNEYIAVVGNDLTIDTAGENVVKTTEKMYHMYCKGIRVCPDYQCGRCPGGTKRPGSNDSYTMSVHADGCTVVDKSGYTHIWTHCNSSYGSGMSAGCNHLLTASKIGVGNCREVTTFCVKCTEGDKLIDYTYTYTYKGLAGVRAMTYVSGDEFRKRLSLGDGSLEDNMLRRSCPVVLAPTITYTAAKFPVNEALNDYNHKTERGARMNTGSADDIPTMEFRGIHMNFDGNSDIHVMRKLNIYGGDLTIDGTTRFNRDLQLDTLPGYASKVFVNANMTLNDAILSTGYSFEGDSRLEILMPNTNLFSGFGPSPYKYKFIFNSGQYFKVKHFQIGAQGGYQPRDDKFPLAYTFAGKIPFVGPTSGEEAKVMTEAFLGWTGFLNDSGYARETYSQVRGVRVELHNKIKWYLQDENDISKKYLLGLSSGSKLAVYPETNTNARIFRGANSNWKECEMANEVTYQRHYVGDWGKCHCDYSSANEDDGNAFIACTVDKDDTRQSINYATETVISSRGHKSGWNSCGNRKTSISNSCQIIYEECKDDNNYSGYPSVELLTCE